MIIQKLSICIITKPNNIPVTNTLPILILCQNMLLSIPKSTQFQWLPPYKHTSHEKLRNFSMALKNTRGPFTIYIRENIANNLTFYMNVFCLLINEYYIILNFTVNLTQNKICWSKLSYCTTL